MPRADRREAAPGAGQAEDAGRTAVIEHRHVDFDPVAPQPEQRPVAGSEPVDRRLPRRAIDLGARPRRGGFSRPDGEECLNGRGSAPPTTSQSSQGQPDRVILQTARHYLDELLVPGLRSSSRDSAEAAFLTRLAGTTVARHRY